MKTQSQYFTQETTQMDQEVDIHTPASPAEVPIREEESPQQQQIKTLLTEMLALKQKIKERDHHETIMQQFKEIIRAANHDMHQINKNRDHNAN